MPASELRERLLAFMVHEIRNPLATALWSAEMLARQPAADGRRERLAQLGVRSLRRLRSLVEDLFALERLPAATPAGEALLGPAIARALGPHDLEPAGIEAIVPAEVPAGLRVAVDPLALDRLLHACLRRMARIDGAGPPVLRVGAADHGVVWLELARAGAGPDELDPPLLSPGGSEGQGTTFTLLLARALAQRMGVRFEIVPGAP